MSSSNMCHCCLEPECLKDIYSEYSCDGRKEIYSHMLSGTFNISISPDNSTKICEQCVTELRRATEFKKKVLKSAKYLATVNCLKVENSSGDREFDDKLSVELEDLNRTVDERATGQLYVIQVNHINVHKDNKNYAKVNNPELADDLDTNEVCSDYIEGTTSYGKKEKNGHPNRVKKKLKQPDSQIHKDLKQNSLKLVFNSNLCLFKSLKTRFGCFLCREAFLSIKELRLHSKTHSNSDLIKAKFNRLRGVTYQNVDISSLECTRCRKGCLDLTDLKKHLTEQHGIKFGDAEHFLIPYKLEDSFNCVLCNEKFNTYMRLSVHMNNHYSNNVCEICGNSYINRISLRIHLQSRHKEKKCSLCSETFLTNYARVRHMRTHHNSCLSKRYCLICGKTFRYSYQLTEHKILEHGAKRQLSKCSLCPKTFPNTQNLKIHVRSVHVRERNFPCNNNACEMRFFTKFDQKRHEKTHLDERSFACELCESKFKGKDSLRRHFKRQHGQFGM